MVEAESPTITVTIKRWRELEELERSVPSLLERAIADYKASRLKGLRERDKADVNLVRERARRYAEKHRESIRERRRLKRHPEECTTNVLMIEDVREVPPTSGVPPTSRVPLTRDVRDSPKENLEADRPGTDHGEPEKGDVIPTPIGPVFPEDACHEHTDAPKPKRKGRPKKVCHQ